MKFKTPLGKTLFIVILIGFAFSLVFIFHFFNFKNSTPNNSVILSKQEEMPVRLKIPKINVDSAVEYVGLLKDGSMDVPKSSSNVAWFDLGTIPGENGSAVIAGHSGWKDGKPAAFDHLYKLNKGDKLSIEDDKGVITTFVVRETRTYDPEADARSVFGSSDGKAHLNLITCSGIWDSIKKSSPNRLVVFTDKE